MISLLKVISVTNIVALSRDGCIHLSEPGDALLSHRRSIASLTFPGKPKDNANQEQ